jgi:hypothetical protein
MKDNSEWESGEDVEEHSHSLLQDLALELLWRGIPRGIKKSLLGQLVTLLRFKPGTSKTHYCYIDLMGETSCEHVNWILLTQDWVQ